MPGVYTGILPRNVRPVFPDRCIVCGRAPAATSTLLISRDGLHGAALWSGWHSVRVPCCRWCGWKLQAWRLWSIVRTLAIAGGALAFGIFYLLPRYEGWVCGLTVLGLCIVGFAAVFVWNRSFPPAFNVDPHDWHVEYEFRDEGLFREFVALNGRNPPMA
jgi:hypothetical protein